MKLEQGCSVVSPEFERHIMDRLAGLEKVISSECIREVLRETGRVNERACTLSHEVMMWVMLSMGLLTDLPIRHVFKAARRWNGKQTPCRSSLCEARQRLGVEPMQALHARVAKPLAVPDTPGAFYRGYRLMAIDGSVFDVPDSAANAVFGRATGGRGSGAFPQVRKVSLVELGTHVEIALALGGFNDSEQTLVSQLWKHLPPDSLLLQDRGLYSYESWKGLDSRVKLLSRVQSRIVLTPIRHLSDRSYLAKIYPTSRDREFNRHGIDVRVIEYTLDDPQRTGHGEVHRLLTNLLDETQFPALELIELYHERWESELVYDEQKTHQDPRRAEKPAHLRSETPDGVRQEMYALSLGHYVVRALMFAAAAPVGMNVDRLSFTGTLHILQCRIPECDTRSAKSLTEWYDNLLDEIRQETIEPRRNRINPRVIKRKMSKWPKKRPHHRRPPPLRKHFAQAVVMLN